MDKNEVPLLKKKTLIKNITVPVDAETKREYERLKQDCGVDMATWLRRVILTELPKLRSRVET